MENPNIHNIPYIRSRDQKRWKGHAKKVVSKEETTERMRKWRAENREKNRQNDLRCRVYRLARQKFGEHDSPEKQQFVRDEITRRLGRRLMMEQQKMDKQHHHHHLHQESSPSPSPSPQQDQHMFPRRGRRLVHVRQLHQEDEDAVVPRTPTNKTSKDDLIELPFYSGSQRKIELPSIDVRRSSFHSSASSSPALPHLSPSWRNERRTSSSSVSTLSSFSSDHVSAFKQPSSPLTEDDNESHSSSGSSSSTDYLALPPMHALLSYAPSPYHASSPSSQTPVTATLPSTPSSPTSVTSSTISSNNNNNNNSDSRNEHHLHHHRNADIEPIRYVEQARILDEFVGVVLNYAGHRQCREHSS
ncbi:hypothetical protein INT45_003926 [Circinella minor]|uniref:DUF3020 domain-containing protein n=1 Tax=Circinella minor TaxID=1195481 RepID=A0A8H7VFX0_9FUNG|nr:hypothetical protein INT45_003926 [Circinella minor]